MRMIEIPILQKLIKKFRLVVHGECQYRSRDCMDGCSEPAPMIFYTSDGYLVYLCASHQAMMKAARGNGVT